MTFRIATWNLDHASRSNRPIQAQKEQINKIGADVLILTETCSDVELSDLYASSASSNPNRYQKHYSAIWSHWPLLQRFETYDDETATCVRVESPFGDLLIYGTILTYAGDKGPEGSSGHWIEHHNEIAKQGEDWTRIQKLTQGIPFIVAGDFNQARDGRGQYHSSKSIELLNSQLQRNSLACLTDEDFGENGKLRPDPRKGYCRHNIDHICVTKGAFQIEKVGAWDHFTDIQELSDHNGVFVDLDLAS